MTSAISEFTTPDLDLDRIARAVGATTRVAYAAPHVYPMGAPAFDQTPFQERERPETDLLRLYVHIPFCKYLCDFCFYAVKLRSSRVQLERYVDAVIRELSWIEPDSKLTQLFVGGGTPTALPGDLLDKVLSAVFEKTTDQHVGVHTVECSPDSISSEHIRVLKKHGVGRISMGVQSLDNRVLTNIHRRHGADQAIEACRLIIDNNLILNIDLIYGLPGQTEEDLRRDLENAAREGVHSVTLYNLRVNEQTPVVKSIAEHERLDNIRTLVRWRAFAQKAATDLGFTQTRWHTFKRLDSEASRHERLSCFDNANMQGYQFGAGMSARSHLGTSVYRNCKDFNVYLDRIEKGVSPVEETFALRAADLKTQFVARSLGDGKSLDRTSYEGVFGSKLEDDFGQILEDLHDAGLIEELDGQISLSETGKLVHDLVTLAFYPDHARKWMKGRERLPFGKRQRLPP